MIAETALEVWGGGRDAMQRATKDGREEVKEEEAGCQGKEVQGLAQQEVAVKEQPTNNNNNNKKQHEALEQAATPAIAEAAERQAPSARHYEELQQLREQHECVICMEGVRSRMLRPCGHLCVCE